MKKSSLFFLFILLGAGAQAQCDKIFNFKEGTTWEWANYDKKGKLLSTTLQKVTEYNASGDEVTTSLSVISTEAKGEPSPEINFSMGCKNGVIYVDMKKFIPDQYTKDENGEAAITVDGENLEMPGDMKAGDVLKDASVTISIGGSSPIPINMKIDVINRKVEAEESINTPAGDFDCLVLRQTTRTKMMITFEIDSKEWYAEGVGTVKSETYKKGKLMGSTVLTSFSR